MASNSRKEKLQKLKETILRNRKIVTNGCGNFHCSNPYCKSHPDNKDKIYSDKEASKLALTLTKNKHPDCSSFAIKKLMSFGCSKENAYKALQKHHGDVSQAIRWIIELKADLAFNREEQKQASKTTTSVPIHSPSVKQFHQQKNASYVPPDNTLKADRCLAKGCNEDALKKGTWLIQMTNQFTDPSLYIISDEKTDLFLGYEWDELVDIEAITIHAIPSWNMRHDVSGPKEIHVYKSRNHIWDDELKPDKIISCNFDTIHQQSKHILNFTKTQYLALFIKTNMNATDFTYLTDVTFQGKVNKESELKTINIKAIKQLQMMNSMFSFVKNSPFTRKLKDTKQDNHNEEHKNMLHELKSEYFEKSEVPVDLEGNLSLITDVKSIAPIICSRCTDNMDCPSVSRVSNVLNRHKMYISAKLSEANDQLNVNALATFQLEVDIGDLLVIKLLNDFHHLLSNHRFQFEDLHNYFTKHSIESKPCQASTCKMMQRNYRDRDNNDLNIRQLYFTENDADIVKQQIIDKIHCYYAHSFDIGDKVSQSENDDKPLTFRLAQNTLQRQVFPSLTKSRKYLIINVDTKAIEEKNDVQNERNIPLFHFGYRYFYWEWAQHNFHIFDPTIFTFQKNSLEFANDGAVVRDWYVSKKYKHFKDELLNNDLYVLPAFKVNHHITQAHNHWKTDYFKAMEICVDEIAPFFGFSHDEIVHVEHIMSMMVYCNETELQAIFTETYRTRPNEHKKQLLVRHSNFANWGRLLREFIYFGDFSQGKDCLEIKLYHGISRDIEFSLYESRICCPFSTSTDKAVAINFCAGRGVLLELQITDSFAKKAGPTFIECCYLSDFPSEQEIFFIGGAGKFIFRNIINISSKVINYKLYVEALLHFASYISEPTNKSYNLPHTYEEKQMVFRLILHQLHMLYPNDDKYHELKSIPLYIDKLLNNQCKSVQIMNVWDTKTRDNMFNRFVFNDGWLNLDVLITIFPALSCIKFIGYKLVLRPFIFDSILAYLEKVTDVFDTIGDHLPLHLMDKRAKAGSRVKQIIIDNPNEEYMTKDNVMEQYDKKFAQYGWIIFALAPRVDNNTLILESLTAHHNKAFCREYLWKNNHALDYLVVGNAKTHWFKSNATQSIYQKRSKKRMYVQ
eukprot:237800_1